MFEAIVNFFYIILYQPLFNTLVFLYDKVSWHDFGIAIIFLTIIIRVILFPISLKAVKSQKALQKLQPQLDDVQKKYKEDKEKQAKEILELYKKEKINPFSALFLGLIQIPILIALYRVFWNGLKPKELSVLYSFVQNPGHINSLFLHFIDLSKPNIIFALLAGVTQYIQAKMLLPKNPGKESDLSRVMQTQMIYFLPTFTVIILISLPSALGLYWTTSALFSIIQQYFFLKEKKSSHGSKPIKQN